MRKTIETYARNIKADIMSGFPSRRANLQFVTRYGAPKMGPELLGLKAELQAALTPLDTVALGAVLDAVPHCQSRDAYGRTAYSLVWQWTHSHLGQLAEAVACPSKRKGGSEKRATGNALHEALTAWVQASPSNPRAHAMLGAWHVALSWAWRGDDFASTLSAKQVEGFRRHGQLSQQIFAASWQTCAADWFWSTAWEASGAAHEVRLPALQHRFTHRLSQTLFCPANYEGLLFMLLPRWHGDLATVESFIASCSESAQNICGDGLYARLYDTVLLWEDAGDLHVDRDRFAGSVEDWLAFCGTDRMRTSFACDLFFLEHVEGCLSQLEQIRDLHDDDWRHEVEPEAANSRCLAWRGL